MTTLLSRNVATDDSALDTVPSVKHLAHPSERDNPANDLAALPVPSEQRDEETELTDIQPTTPAYLPSPRRYLEQGCLAREMERDGWPEPSSSPLQYMGCALAILLAVILVCGVI